MTLMEQLEKFVASGNFSEEELKELETLSGEIIAHIEKKNVRKYYKLITDQNKDKLIYKLQNYMPFKFNGLIVGEVVSWSRQFGEIYGELVMLESCKHILRSDDFDLVLNDGFVSGVVGWNSYEGQLKGENVQN